MTQGKIQARVNKEDEERFGRIVEEMKEKGLVGNAGEAIKEILDSFVANQASGFGVSKYDTYVDELNRYAKRVPEIFTQIISSSENELQIYKGKINEEKNVLEEKVNSLLEKVDELTESKKSVLREHQEKLKEKSQVVLELSGELDELRVESDLTKENYEVLKHRFDALQENYDFKDQALTDMSEKREELLRVNDSLLLKVSEMQQEVDVTKEESRDYAELLRKECQENTDMIREESQSVIDGLNKRIQEVLDEKSEIQLRISEKSEERAVIYETQILELRKRLERERD